MTTNGNAPRVGKLRGSLGRYLTTYQTAKLCHCAPRTVSRWCDQGLLPCRRLPGNSMHERRIARADLVAFLFRAGWAEEARAIGGGAVLLYGLGAGAITTALPVAVAATALHAGAALLAYPRAVVVDLSAVGSAGVRDLRGYVAELPEPWPALVAVHPEDVACDRTLWAAVAPAPVGPEALGRLVEAAVRE